MMGDDPIADSLRSSFTAAAKRIRPARTASQGDSGIFDSSISISIPSSITAKPLPPRYWDSEQPEVVYEVVLPDSDRAKKLTRKEREVKRVKRRKAKASRKKNRKK